MLSIENIINFLEPVQKNFVDTDNSVIQADEDYNKNIIEKDYNTSILPQIYESILSKNKFYNYKIKGYNTYIKSVLGALNHNYLLFSDLDKIKTIRELANTMLVAIEEDNLHKKFGYSRKKLFRKQVLRELLMKDKTDFDNIKCDNVKQYIADYFGINIFIIILDDCDNYIGNVSFIHNKYNSIDCPPAVNILLQKKYGRYSPILKINSNSSVLILSEDYDVIIKLNNVFNNINLDLCGDLYKESEISIEKEDIVYKDPVSNIKVKNLNVHKYTKKELDKKNLNDIQLLANNLSIKIKIKSEKTGKLINVKKQMLINNILTI